MTVTALPASPAFGATDRPVIWVRGEITQSEGEKKGKGKQRERDIGRGRDNLWPIFAHERKDPMVNKAISGRAIFVPDSGKRTQSRGKGRKRGRRRRTRDRSDKEALTMMSAA